jgi:hypothetical protein
LVDDVRTKQDEGFDFYDYAYLDTSANPYGANNIGVYVAGAQARASTLSAFMALTPLPTLGGPPQNIGPQYAWPYQGGVAGQGHAFPLLTPTNVAPAQRTRFRVRTADVIVAYLDERTIQFLSAWLAAFPAQAVLGPTAGLWPLPVFKPLYAAVGNYTFDKKWIWLLYQRRVAGADGDLEVYAEG